MIDPSSVEKVTASIPVQGAANAVAAFGATITPLAAFVPFLFGALASGRQSQRLEAMFNEINAVITANAEKLKDISDDQYKFVNEAISAAFYTINQEKIELLKRAVTNAFLNPDSVLQISDSLSRVLRDISASEVEFIVKNYSFKLIVVRGDSEGLPKTLAIKPNSSEEIILSGIINLGLLYPKTTRVGSMAFEWSPLVIKLIRVLKE